MEPPRYPLRIHPADNYRIYPVNRAEEDQAEHEERPHTLVPLATEFSGPNCSAYICFETVTRIEQCPRRPEPSLRPARTRHEFFTTAFLRLGFQARRLLDEPPLSLHLGLQTCRLFLETTLFRIQRSDWIGVLAPGPAGLTGLAIAHSVLLGAGTERANHSDEENDSQRE